MKRLLRVPDPEQKFFEVLRRVSEGEVFVTGGAVRDALCGRPILDLDITVVFDEPKVVAQSISRALSWTMVPLHEEFGVYRVTKSGFNVDVSGLRPGATSLEDDLKLRDFTINAMAVPLKEFLEEEASSWNLVDPCGGRRDLFSKVIRAVSERSFRDDPLRILRAYRFESEGFGRIERKTREMIRNSKKGLRRVARERISSELTRILETSSCAGVFLEMKEDGVLFELFPEMLKARGVPQPDFHHLDVLDHCLEALRASEEVLKSPAEFFGSKEPFEELLADHERRVAVKLASLFHDIGKPLTFAVRERITFYEHERIGAELFLRRAEALRFKKDLARRVAVLIRNHMRPFHLLSEKLKGNLTPRAKRRLVRDVPEVEDLFVVAAADALAARGPAKDPSEFSLLRELFWEVLEVKRLLEERVEKKRLVTGHDLIAMGLKPGPVFRRLLDAVEEAVVEGRVSSREEALEYVKRLVYSEGLLPSSLTNHTLNS